MTDALLQLVGRIHPMVLHIPLGMLGALIVVEGWSLLRRRAPERSIRLLLIWSLAISAGTAVASGIVLSDEPSYVGDTLELHRWLGIFTAGLIAVTALLASLKQEAGYRTTLVLACMISTATGHFGATMTHGPTFLTEPFAANSVTPPDNPRMVGDPSVPSSTWYESTVAPLLAQYCIKCHGAERQKADLALHTAGAIAAGSVLDGEMLRRLQAPFDDDDHMPPESKPQLTDTERAALSAWLEAGASFDAPAPITASSPHVPSAPPSEIAGPKLGPVLIPVDTLNDAIAALRTAHVHVQFMDPVARTLWIDFGAMPEIPVNDVVRLLHPLAPAVTELSLRNMSHANEVLVRGAPWPRLEHLNLASAELDADGLGAATASGRLRELNVTQTTITAAASARMMELHGLERIHLWQSTLDDDALLALRSALPDTVINDGAVTPPPALEVEQEFTFGVVDPTDSEPAALTPVNTICPVSGAAIDSKYTILHQDQLIAFCCEKCAASFWQDPEKYPVTRDRSP